MSAITMSVTPMTDKAAAVSMPTAPAPTTNALDPSKGTPAPDPAVWLRLIPCSDTASGSTRAPCSKVTFSGSLWHMSAGCVMLVCSVPSAWGKVLADDLNDNLAQRLYRPLEHSEQARQGSPTSRATRSPTFRSEAVP